jgi:hypothetical protein
MRGREIVATGRAQVGSPLEPPKPSCDWRQLASEIRRLDLALEAIALIGPGAIQSKPTKQTNPKATLGDARWLGAVSLTALCAACNRRQLLNIRALSDSVLLSWIAQSLHCQHCGHIGAYVLPDFMRNEESSGGSSDGDR